LKLFFLRFGHVKIGARAKKKKRTKEAQNAKCLWKGHGNASYPEWLDENSS